MKKMKNYNFWGTIGDSTEEMIINVAATSQVEVLKKIEESSPKIIKKSGIYISGEIWFS